MSKLPRTLILTGVVFVLSGCSSDNSTGPSVPTEPPTLSSINGATLPSGPIGSTVMLEGTNFGVVQGAAQVLFSSGAGGTVSAIVTSGADWTNGFIITTVPAGAVTGPVRVLTVVDTSNAITFTITQNASFSPSTILWNATTPLPTGLSGHAAVYTSVQVADTIDAVNAVYVTGGSDSADSHRTDVIYSIVQGDGQLGPWIPTASLPAPIAFHAAVAATPANSRVDTLGVLYVLGGAIDSSGVATAAVYQAPIRDDGSLGSWTSGTPLPLALHSLEAVIFNGNLYVLGGATSGNVPSGAVYRSRIGTDGVLGNWVSQSSLPSPRSYLAASSFGGYLYSLGGETDTVSVNDPTASNNATKSSQVVVARVHLPTGNLQPWSDNGSGLIKAVSKHTAVVAGGYVLASGGLYNGAANGSTEESYSQFESAGGLGSFSGATGTHTIASAGGGYPFNHAAVSYVDPNGIAHVLVIGGDDADMPGTKHREAWYN